MHEHEKGFIHIVDGEGKSVHKIPKHHMHPLVTHLIGEHVPEHKRHIMKGMKFGSGSGSPVHHFHHEKVPAAHIREHAKKVLHSGEGALHIVHEGEGKHKKGRGRPKKHGAGIYEEEAVDEFKHDTRSVEYDPIHDTHVSTGLGGKTMTKKMISSPPMNVSGAPLGFVEGSRGPQKGHGVHKAQDTRIKYFPEPLF